MTTVTPTSPSPAARLGMTLFLASEAMFALGVVSAYFVLRAGHRELFASSAAVLSKTIVVTQIALLIAASVAAMKWSRPRAIVVVGLLVGYGLTQGIELTRLTVSRGTVVVADKGGMFVYDGTVSPRASESVTVRGRKAVMPDGFDIHESTPASIEALGPTDATGVVVPSDTIRAEAHYGPSRNNYFGCYFLLTLSHTAHVAGGLIAVLWFMYKPSAVGTVLMRSYVQFFNAVGVALLLILAMG